MSRSVINWYGIILKDTMETPKYYREEKNTRESQEHWNIKQYLIKQDYYYLIMNCFTLDIQRGDL